MPEQREIVDQIIKTIDQWSINKDKKYYTQMIE